MEGGVCLCRLGGSESHASFTISHDKPSVISRYTLQQVSFGISSARITAFSASPVLMVCIHILQVDLDVCVLIYGLQDLYGDTLRHLLPRLIHALH